MLRYLIRRLLWAVVLFVGVTLISFALFFLIPTDPARQACGKACTGQPTSRALRTPWEPTGRSTSSTVGSSAG